MSTSRKRCQAGGSGSDERGGKKPRKNPAPRGLSAEKVNLLGNELLWACRLGNTAEAKRLIAEGAPVDWQNEHGYAPLHWASFNGHTEIVMLLLENKCNLNVTNKWGNTPLILAAWENQMGTVRALVEAGCDITIRGKKNKTAAEWAKVMGYPAIAKYLTYEAPLTQFYSSARDKSKARVDSKPPRLSKEQANYLGMQLLDACWGGKTAEAKRLIAEGAPVDWQNEHGWAPLHEASSRGYLEIVMLLLENKCNLNVIDKYGSTPLIDAARNNNMTIARELVWSLSDLKIRNTVGKTAAEEAKERGYDALAEYLANQALREQAEIRADPSRKEALRKQYQPQAEQERREWLGKKLYYACAHRKTAEAKRLIAEGAPVDRQDLYGYAPLHLASLHGYTEIVMLLLKNKCNPDITTKTGTTPLMMAAENANTDTVRALVEAGCDITIRDSENKTAAERAKERRPSPPPYYWTEVLPGHHAIAKYLSHDIRFLPSADDESDNPHRVQGMATRALRRDLLETGLLPAGPLSLVKEFATG